MFGFNKDEVLEYLEELADENAQRQEVAERRIQELMQKLQKVETGLAAGQANPQDPNANAQMEAQRRQLHDTLQNLDIAKLATQQSEEELQEYKELFSNAQQQIAWLQQEYQQSQQTISDLSSQMEATALSGTPDGREEAERLRMQLIQAVQENDQMRYQLEQLTGETDQLRNQISQSQVGAVQEAEQLRNQVTQLSYEAEQLRNQLTHAQTNSSGYTTQETEQLRSQVSQLGYEAEQLRSQLAQAQQAQTNSSSYTTQETEQLRHQLGLADQDISELRGLLEQVNSDNGALQNQIQDMYSNPQAYGIDGVNQQVSSAILAEANAEADRIRDEAFSDRDRLQKQIRNSSAGINESIANLRSEITNVEGGVAKALESVQYTLSEIIGALSRTEQHLNTYSTQVERFPSSSPAVPSEAHQQLVYFNQNKQASAPEVDTFSSPAASGLRRVEPEATRPAKQPANIRPFRATYSTSPTAQAAYWPQTAEALEPDEEEGREERLRTLSESLVDTLRQMME